MSGLTSLRLLTIAVLLLCAVQAMASGHAGRAVALVGLAAAWSLLAIAGMRTERRRHGREQGR